MDIGAAPSAAAQPRAPHVTKLPSWKFAPLLQFYNQALYSGVVASLPFNSVEFAHSNLLPDWQPAPPPPLNINLFTNPFPFNQTDWSKADTIPRAPFDLSVPLNPNLLNLFPFNQIDWSKPVTVPRAPWSIDQALNINLFTNPFPFSQTGPATAWLDRATPAPDQIYNPNLYSVVVLANPFNQTNWSPGRFPRPTASADQPLNLNLFTTVIQAPFIPVDWSRPFVPRPASPLDQTLNPNLFTNPIPFSQTDWSKPFKVLPLSFSPPATLNLNLFTNPIPFAQVDWARPSRLRTVPIPPDTLNLNLFGAVSGIVLFDAVSSSTVAGSAGTTLSWTHTPVASPPSNAGVLLQNYTASSIDVSGVTYGGQVLTQYAAATGGVIGISPCQTQIWGSDGLTMPSGSQTVTITFTATGAFCIAGAITVTGGNTTTCFSVANAASATSTAPTVTLSGTSAGEFTVDIAGNGVSDATLVPGGLQTLRFGVGTAGGDNAAGSSLPSGASSTTMSWTTTSSDLWTISAASFKAGAFVGGGLPLNQNYWSVGRFPRAPIFQDLPLNLNLFTNPIPFNQTDWAKPLRSPRASVQPDTLNPNIFTNPIPFNQIDWSRPIKVSSVALDQQPLNLNLFSFVLVSLPLNQTDWSKPFRVPLAPFASPPLNLNLFTNPIPFMVTDRLPNFRIPKQPQPPTGINPNLFKNPVPFSQVDWAKPLRVRGYPNHTLPQNLNLLSKIIYLASMNATERGDFFLGVLYQFNIPLRAYVDIIENDPRHRGNLGVIVPVAQSSIIASIVEPMVIPVTGGPVSTVAGARVAIIS